MKISKIYANKSFKNVSFNETGLNVIIGKISDRKKNRGIRNTRSSPFPGSGIPACNSTTKKIDIALA